MTVAGRHARSVPVFPRVRRGTEAVSPEVDTDIIINRLNDVTPNDRCEIDVLQNELRDSRINVVEFLVKKFGDRYEYRVYTGSHNLSYSANAKFDEIFVKLAAETGNTHPVYDAYRAHFKNAYAGDAF